MQAARILQVRWKSEGDAPARPTLAAFCGATGSPQGSRRMPLPSALGSAQMESARSSGGAGAYRNAKRLNRLREALAMNPEQRRAFEAAAVRTSSPRRREGGSVRVGPWPSAGATTLPFTLTHFIGREAELDEIAALLREHRVVTLTGAGGVGKTQTALRAAAVVNDAAMEARTK